MIYLFFGIEMDETRPNSLETNLFGNRTDGTVVVDIEVPSSVPVTPETKGNQTAQNARQNGHPHPTETTKINVSEFGDNGVVEGKNCYFFNFYI